MKWNKSPKLAAFLAIVLAGLLSYPFQFASNARADSDEGIAAKDNEDGHPGGVGKGRGNNNDNDNEDKDETEPPPPPPLPAPTTALLGSIESLSPATGMPNQLSMFGVLFNIGGAKIVLGENETGSALNAGDLAASQFVELQFTGTNASVVTVWPAAVKGPLQTLVMLSSPPSIMVNRNTRIIQATFTVDGVGILCDNTFTHVLGKTNACANLTGMVNTNVAVVGVMVGNFGLSLTDLITPVIPRTVILAASVRPN